MNRYSLNESSTTQPHQHYPFIPFCSRDGISVTPILGVLVAIGCGLALVAVAIIFVLRFKMTQIIIMDIDYLLQYLSIPFQVQALQLIRPRRLRQRRLLRQKQRRQRLQGKQILID